MKLVMDMTSNDYHQEKNHYSSSQLKDILFSAKLFHGKYIAKTIPREDNPAFDIGTYFHTAVLEPHLLAKECAVYDGIRNGAKWEAFQKLHAGKAIITKSEKLKAENCINAINACPISRAYVDLGKPEVSAFIRLFVVDSTIYFFRKDKIFRLTYSGWVEDILVTKEYVLSGVEVGLKVRADIIDLEGTSIADLKSASGDVADEYQIKNKTSELHYDLSAALYLDIFSAVIGRAYTDFIWLYASKQLHAKLNSPVGKPWRADADNVRIGRAKWAKAVIDIAYYQNINWQLESDTSILSDLSPKEHEYHWLSKKYLEPGEVELSDLSRIKEQIEINKKAIKPTLKENDMKINEVNYQRTFKVGEYESERIGFSAVLEEGDTALEAVLSLRKDALDAFNSTNAKAETKKETSKLKVEKEEKAEKTKKEEAPKEEPKKEKKKAVVTTPFDYENDDHRADLGATLDKLCKDWRKDAEAKALAKKTATGLTGTEYLDANGEVLESFLATLKSKMAKYVTSEENDDDL